MTQNEELLQKALKINFVLKDLLYLKECNNSDASTHFSLGCDMNMPGGPYQTSEMTGKDGSFWRKLPI